MGTFRVASPIYMRELCNNATMAMVYRCSYFVVTVDVQEHEDTYELTLHADPVQGGIREYYVTAEDKSSALTLLQRYAEDRGDMLPPDAVIEGRGFEPGDLIVPLTLAGAL